MTPQQLKAMKLALEALKLNNKEWKSLADSGDAGYWKAEDQDHYKQTEEAITALEEALADHAMREVQRLGQEIEPDDIASILACRDMLDAQPVPPRTWVGSGDLEDSNAYLTLPQRKPLTHKEIWNAIRPLTQSDAVCMSLVQISMDEYRAIEAAHGIKETK